MCCAATFSRYFPSIDHAILKAEFRRRIACERTLWLMDRIVDGSNAQEPVLLFPWRYDCSRPSSAARPAIGNLTSQFFANLYLDRFDHFVTEVLRAPYVRYVDDFALFHDDPARSRNGRRVSRGSWKAAAASCIRARPPSCQRRSPRNSWASC